MKLNLTDFRDALTKVTPAIGEGNIALTVLKGGSDLIVSAVRGAFAIFVTIPNVTDAEPMNIEVNADKVKSLMPLFFDPELELRKINNALNFKTANGNNINLPVITMDLVDVVDNKSDAEYVKDMKVKFITHYVNETAHALQSRATASMGGDARLSAYYLETDGEHIRITTTDKFRVSIRAGALGDITNRYTIPGAEFKAAIALIGDDVIFRIPKDGEFLQMVGENIVIVMPILATEYFNLQGIINNIENSTNKLTVTVARDQLINICKIVQVIAGVNPKMVFEVKGLKLELSTVDKTGDFERALDIEKNPDGKNLRVVFSAKYILDALESLRAKRVDMIIDASLGLCEIVSHVEENDKAKPGKAIEIVLPIKA